MRFISAVKQLIVPRGPSPRTIKAGPFRNLRMELDLASQSQLYFGLFERELHPWLRRLATGIRSAVDIGCGHGEYTLYFPAKTSAERVFAFEPDARMRPHIQTNLRLSGLDEDSRLIFSSECVGATNNGNVSTLDSLIPLLSLPCLLKMDVDGAETEILNGATNLIKMPGVRWVIETHSKKLELECIRILRQAGFRTQIVRNAWWRAILPELRVSEQNRWLTATNDGCL